MTVPDRPETDILNICLTRADRIEPPRLTFSSHASQLITMNHIYLLYHLAKLRSGDQQVLFVGAYKTRPSALRAIDRLKKLPGFKNSPKLRDHKTDHGDGFNINRVRLGSDNWPEGFSEDP